MRNYVTIICLSFISFHALSQDSIAHNSWSKIISYKSRAHIFTGFIGIADLSRYDYVSKLPDTFWSKDMKGFSSMGLKYEYSLKNRLGIGLNFNYDKYIVEYDVLTFGYVTKYYKNIITQFSIGPNLYYHFRHKKHRRTDYFTNIGFVMTHRIENHSNKHGGEATTITNEDSISPVIRIGLRYYVDNNMSLFLDGGYDKMSLISFGFSYRVR